MSELEYLLLRPLTNRWILLVGLVFGCCVSGVEIVAGQDPPPPESKPATETPQDPEPQPTPAAEKKPPAQEQPQEPEVKHKFAIAIHGGAGSSAKNASEASIAKRKAVLTEALQKGVGILESGGSALDAVENVILILENDPQFNAGKGAVFNAAGSHELDASIMDGSNLACGAVSGVSHVKNPISLARLVMVKTPHVLLSGAGAEAFAKQENVHWVEPDYFDTPKAKASFERYKLRMNENQPEQAGEDQAAAEQTLQQLRQQLKDDSFEREWSIGTVGCVALDSQGNLAAGTSTGGMTYKKFGRVGDSPIVGAGTYADNETCAVSATGIGEEYIRKSVAYDVSAQMKYKQVSLEEAVNDNLNRRLRPGDGGLIAVDKDGNIFMGFNTGGMARAAADSNGRFEVIWGEPAAEGEKQE